MLLAIISLAKDDPESGVPVGLLPLFDDIVVDRQVRTAARIGAEKIIFLCPTMPGAILQYMDRLKGEGIDAEIVRTASDLVQYASEDDRLIIFGDGILPSDSIETDLSEQTDEMLYVVANADIFESFERIDLNQRWVGLAGLKASRLSLLIDIPDDWDVSSALLRIAVQSECKRHLISDIEMTDGAVMSLANASKTAEYTKRELKAPELSKAGLFDNIILWPIVRRFLPRFWQTPNAKLGLQIGISAFVAIAVILAYFQFPITALALLLCTNISSFTLRQFDLFAQRNSTSLWLRRVLPVFAWAAMILVIIQYSPTNTVVPNIVILFVLQCSLMALNILPKVKMLKGREPDRRLVGVVMLFAAIFGHFLVGLYVVTALAAFFVGAKSSGLRSESGTWPKKGF